MARTTASAERDDGEGIFLKNGDPVRFYFHRSVTEGVHRIFEDIVANGGVVAEDERDADVLLVDEEANIDIIRRRYYSSEEAHRRRIFVEPRGFVRRCVRDGVYEHRNPHRREGMPGPRPLVHAGRVRVNFTREDDEHLAHYIATIFPDEKAGGRMGNIHYKELEQLSQYREYRWAARHTWHSWRERYKKNKAYFDPIIANIVNTLGDGHGYGHEHRSRLYRGIRAKPVDLEDEDEEEERGTRGNAARGAREYLRQNEDQLVAFDAEEEGSPGGETVTYASVRLPRKHGRSESDAHSRKMVSSRKRARVSQSASSRPQTSRASRAEHRQGKQKNVSDRDSSQPLQSDEDLFGSYETPDMPAPHSPVLNGVEAAPEMTQYTLVGSPRAARRKEQDVSCTSGHRQDPPPTSQLTLVAVQEAIVEERGIVENVDDEVQPRQLHQVAYGDARRWSGANRNQRRGAVPGPSPDAPAWNTRARSRSLEPQPTIVRTVGGTRSKRKGRQRELDLEFVPEDQESLPILTSGQHLSTKDTFTDGRRVEYLSEGEASNVPSHSDKDSLPPLSPHQDMKRGDDQLLDSDDAETHRNLQQSFRPTHLLEENDDDAKFSQSTDDSVLEFEEDDAEIEEKLERMRRARLTQSVQNAPSDARLQFQGRSVGDFTSVTPR
ncbi:hypothetical protein EDC04DRAFT_2718259 [Pisolithus marmoratus]|nr:hypothetical protein EDC04DRAFT_2718259 [Pisolithus marmoratus]